MFKKKEIASCALSWRTEVHLVIGLKTGNVYSLVILSFKKWGEYYIRDCSLSLSFSFLAAPGHMEFPGLGSDLSCSCNLCLSWGNSGSLTHCAMWWSNLNPRAPEMLSIPSHHSGNSTLPVITLKVLPSNVSVTFKSCLEYINWEIWFF